MDGGGPPQQTDSSSVLVVAPPAEGLLDLKAPLLPCTSPSSSPKLTSIRLRFDSVISAIKNMMFIQAKKPSKTSIKHNSKYMKKLNECKAKQYVHAAQQ